MADKFRRKTGGRKPGVPNKDKLELRQLVQKRYPNYNPILALIEISLSKDEEVTYDNKIACHKEVAQYMFSKLRTIEVKGEDFKDASAILELVNEMRKYRESSKDQ